MSIRDRKDIMPATARTVTHLGSITNALCEICENIRASHGTHLRSYVVEMPIDRLLEDNEKARVEQTLSQALSRYDRTYTYATHLKCLVEGDTVLLVACVNKLQRSKSRLHT